MKRAVVFFVLSALLFVALTLSACDFSVKKTDGDETQKTTKETTLTEEEFSFELMLREQKTAADESL
ncbi:MAG: hypothetical protein J6125_00530, partial [Clostridia bacterium]|nr:hypothetical protein [Clostridia bacterium]